MNNITYNGVTYHSTEFWQLIDALRSDGYVFKIEDVPRCAVRGAHVNITVRTQTKNLGCFSSVSQFLALGKLVAEIQKAGAK